MIQMKGITVFSPNDITHPEFGAALRSAAEQGVQIKAIDCIVTPDSMTPDREIKVKL